MLTAPSPSVKRFNAPRSGTLARESWLGEIDGKLVAFAQLIRR